MQLPKVEVGGLSVVGPIREDNQDAILFPDGAGPAMPGSLQAVADGMGGYSHGGVASRMALKSLSLVLQQAHTMRPEKALLKGVEAANLDVFRAAHKLAAGRMGTTITAAYLIGVMLHIVHVGDSRAYLVRDGSARCLTSDHTLVADMVRSRLIGPERVRTHAQRSILTRAVGISPFIQPELLKLRLHPDDRLILCSDGVWSVVQDDEFARLALQAPNPDSLSQALVDLAIERKTDDNCSVVAVYIPEFHPVPEMESHSLRSNWFRLVYRDEQEKHP